MGLLPSSPSQRRPYWSGIPPQPPAPAAAKVEVTAEAPVHGIGVTAASLRVSKVRTLTSASWAVAIRSAVGPLQVQPGKPVQLEPR